MKFHDILNFLFKNDLQLHIMNMLDFQSIRICHKISVLVATHNMHTHMLWICIYLVGCFHSWVEETASNPKFYSIEAIRGLRRDFVWRRKVFFQAELFFSIKNKVFFLWILWSVCCCMQYGLFCKSLLLNLQA